MDEETANALASLFVTYRRGFDESDREVVAGCIELPMIAMSVAGVRAALTSAQLEAMLEGLFDAHRANGYRRSTFEIEEVERIHDDYAQADLHWRVIGEGARVVWDYRVRYTLRRGAAGWRIRAYVPLD